MGAGAPANRRRARALLCATVALTGIALVILVAGRETVRRRETVSAVRVEAPAVAALPAGVARETVELWPSPAAEVRPAWQPPVAARARRDDGGTQRSESPSLARDDWRQSVADALDREALDALPRDPGAMHTHERPEAAAPEARAPALVMGATAPSTQGLEGWDGGKFWFGPQGLVRMKEAQP